MSMDNKQLKEESILDDQPVLTDINPITNTLSVDDSATGEKLNKTIARMWEAINNHISRYVNSVNGRTGVVVLTSADVGLDNVDNVSFYEIKQWVIDQIESVFKNKRLRLYQTFRDALNAKDSNDRALAWSPFYCDIYDDNDRRSVIGFFGWDTGLQILTIEYRMMNTVGFADDSMIYKTDASDYDCDRDLPVGSIGVNIYPEANPDDQILYLETGAGAADTKRNKGLRIDKNKVGSHVYYFDTPYGTPGAGGFTGDSLLWKYGTSDANKGYRVKIYINGEVVSPKYITSTSITGADSEVVGDGFFYIDKTWSQYDNLHINDVIFMRFASFVTSAGIHSIDNYSTYAPSAGVSTDFSNRQPSVGYVQKTTETENAPDFEIHFYELQPNTRGYGIATLPSMRDRDVPSNAIALNIGRSTQTPTNVPYPNTVNVNMSGLNAAVSYYGNGTFASEIDRSHNGVGTSSHTLWGVPLQFGSNGQMSIETDGSLCVFPEYQSRPTALRQWFRPEFVANKFYKKNSDDTYQLLETRPSNWLMKWYTYYEKTGEDEYTALKGIVPLYAVSRYKNAEYAGETNTEEQSAVGSLLSYNFAVPNTLHQDVELQSTDYAEHWDGSSRWRTLDLNHPLGMNPEDGVLGTPSMLSVNLAKISTRPYAGVGVPGTEETYGYTFYNISGFRQSTPDLDFAGTQNNRVDTTDFYANLGLPDKKDAYGKSVKDTFTRGGQTDGLAVNTGRFLEITPKRTYRAETYWDGGKVQVRIGKGLKEQTDDYDVTSIIKNAGATRVTIPDTMPFDDFTFRRAWYTRSEEFDLIIETEDGDAHPSFEIMHIQLSAKPDDWDLNWMRYEYNVGTDDDPDYVFLPVVDDLVIGFDESEANYMGPYYRPTRAMGFPLTISEMQDWLLNDSMGKKARVVWKFPVNRIALNIDPETLEINNKGQLTVIATTPEPEPEPGPEPTPTPEPETSPGRNIRVVDTRGVFFDTIPYEEDDEGHPKYPIDEVMSLGPGLKITGAGVAVPLNMKLWGNYSNPFVSSGRTTYSLLILEIWDNMTFGERTEYFRHYLSNNLGGSAVYNGTALSYTQFEQLSDNVRQRLKMLPISSYKQENADHDFSSSAVECQSEMTGSEVVEFKDEDYNIAIHAYPKSDVRAYLSMREEDIRDNLENILLGVECLLDGTSSNTSDPGWDEKKIKILQYFADHYNMGSVTSLDHEINMNMWETKLPYISDSQSDDPFPLDWAFSFFTQAILVEGEWSKIVGAQYTYTEISSKPGDWDVHHSNYLTDSLNYFYFQNTTGTKEPNTNLVIVPDYKPNAYWRVEQTTTTGDNWRYTFTPITNASISDWADVFQQYAICVNFRILSSATAPANWSTEYMNYFVRDNLSRESDPELDSPMLLKHVTGDTAPEYVQNTYYAQDNDGTIKAWIILYKRVAYYSNEIGTANNTIKCAPVFEADKYYAKTTEGGVDVYTVLDTIPDDWYTDFNTYYIRTGEEGDYTYILIQGEDVGTIFGSISGQFYTRTLST